MQTEKLHKKLDELFENKKSRNFINHLIRSYLPISKTSKVYNKPKGSFRCVITDAPLISINEVLSGMQTEEYKDKFLTQLKAVTSEEQNVQNPMTELLKGKILAFTGEKTDTCMSHEGLQVFYDWTMTKMLKGDKHINWLLSSMERERFIARAESVANDDETRAAVSRLKKSTNKGKRAMNKLGDLDVLQKLKDKMNSAEKKIKNENK